MSTAAYIVIMAAMIGTAIGICLYRAKQARRQMKRKPPTWRNGRIEK